MMKVPSLPAFFSLFPYAPLPLRPPAPLPIVESPLLLLLPSTSTSNLLSRLSPRIGFCRNSFQGFPVLFFPACFLGARLRSSFQVVKHHHVRHSWSYHPQQRPVQQAYSTQHSPAQRTQSTLELLNLGISLIIRPSPCLAIRLSVCLSLCLLSCHVGSTSFLAATAHPVPTSTFFSKRLSAAFHLQVRVNSKVV